MSFVNVSHRPGIERPGVCLTVGCPGSGKTTWAHSVKAEDTLVVEKDMFRIAMFGSKQEYFDHPMDKDVKAKTLRGACLGAMKNWRPGKFIVANTNIHAHWAAPFIRFAVKNDLPIHVAVFTVPLDVLQQRNITRPACDFVPLDRIREAYDDITNPENQWWRDLPRDISVEYVNRPDLTEAA